jgi:hypothetical protein
MTFFEFVAEHPIYTTLLGPFVFVAGTTFLFFATALIGFIFETLKIIIRGYPPTLTAQAAPPTLTREQDQS